MKAKLFFGYLRRKMFALVCFSCMVPGCALFAPALAAQSEVTVVVKADATVEGLAAAELAGSLAKLYPRTKFVASEKPGAQKNIYVGTPATLPPEFAARVHLNGPGSYAIAADGNTATIAGADAVSVRFAVEALKRKLGFGEYLSFRTVPEPRATSFSFDGWQLADAPIARERVVFDWHNFLSGCSTWNLKEWKQWIDQSARMRFNTVMVHAYGNNPIFRFSLNGQTKPTGYLPNTERGRDWGTEHVSDVRNLVGAGSYFPAPVFGADASLATEENKDAAAEELMQKVFAYAASRGLGVTFALDVDTEPANPQNVIAMLPASARFAVHGVSLVNPETPEGYAYYRAEIEALMKLYPEITQLAVWFRGGLNSPWREIAPADFPEPWRAEFATALEAHPQLKRDPEAPSMFAIGKIARVFRRALDETGHTGVTMTAGSWRFNYLPAADAFFPESVGLMPLDYDYQFAGDPAQESLREIGRHRALIPIVWAQHDDREYAGRSYTPIAGLGSLVRWSNSSGIGIIHWTTRPLDLFFANVADQVWKASLNETLDATAGTMARNLFGAAAAEPGRKYLLDWIYDAPAFGEETTDKFVNRNHVLDVVNEQAGAAERLRLLEELKPLVRTTAQRDWVGYYEDWERYASAVYRAQDAYQSSGMEQRAGRLKAAREKILAAHEQEAVEAYARTIHHGEISRGELGILVSLNLRWLPMFAAQRQALGLEPLEIVFAPTKHEPLAQGEGHYSYRFDREHKIAEVAGVAELGTEVRELPPGSCGATGIVVGRPVTLSLEGLMGTPLSGTWKVKLRMAPEAKVQADANEKTLTAGSSMAFTVEAGHQRVKLALAPLGEPAVVCGVTLEAQP